MDVETTAPLLAIFGSVMAAVGTAFVVQCGKSRQAPKGKTASLKDSASKSLSEKKSKKSKRETPKSTTKKPLEQSAKKELSAKTAKPIEKTQTESSKTQKSKAESKDVEELNVELGNKPVVLQPGELHFKPNGGLQKVALHNPTAERQAIKIKCSDNKIYRVSPVFAFVDAGATLDVEVFREQGAPKLDKLVFVTSAATASDHNPKYCFAGAAAAKNTAAVLPLVA